MKRQLRRRFLIWLVLFLPLVLITTTSAWLAYTELYALKLQPAISAQTALIDRLSSRIHRELGYLGQLTRMLRSSIALEEALAGDRPPNKRLLARHFTRFSDTSGLIAQVRWLDQYGQEQVRVNLMPNGAQRTPESELQNKSSRYYFRDALNLAPGELYFSPLDLNIEHGVLVMPLEPTLRTAMRTSRASGLHAGVLVINFSLSSLFNELRALQTENQRLELVNQDGYWLLHPDPAREWGHVLGQDRLTLAHTAPRIWQQVQQQASRRGVLSENRIWSHSRIEPLQSEDRHWHMILSGNANQLAGIRYQILMPTLAVSALVLLIGGAFLWRVARGEESRLTLLQELKAEQEELRQTNRQLSESLERQQRLQDELVETRKLSSLGMMVAGVAHELNTPTGGTLVTVTSMEESLHQLEDSIAQGQLTQGEMQDYLKHAEEGLQLAHHNLQRTADLVRSFKRLAVDRSLDEPVNFSLQTCADDLANSLRPQLKKCPVKLDITLPECQLFSHPGILSQVLQNLIENALQHGFDTDTPGRIELRGRLLEGTELEIQVEDNGRGIEAERLDTLFDPFVTSGRSEGHTGLGLHLVHQWVTQVLQGGISIQSTPGQGTCFTLRVPLDIRGRQTSP